MTDLPDVFELDAHPAADVWPMLAADELDALAESIRTVGQLHPLVVWHDGGKWWLLDGRNRRDAMRALDGIEPEVTTYDGFDPYSYVLGANEHRRHATASQRGMAIAKSANAKVGGDRRGHSAILQNGELTSTEAAAKGGVSTRIVDSCRYVIAHAPELVDAVLAGTIRAAAAEAEARRIVAARQREADEARQRLEKQLNPETIRAQAPDLAEQLADEDTEAEAIAKEYRDRVRVAQETVHRWNKAAADLLNAVARLRTLVATDDEDSTDHGGGYVDLAAKNGVALDEHTLALAHIAQAAHTEINKEDQ